MNSVSLSGGKLLNSIVDTRTFSVYDAGDIYGDGTVILIAILHEKSPTGTFRLIVPNRPDSPDIRYNRFKFPVVEESQLEESLKNNDKTYSLTWDEVMTCVRRVY